MAQTARSVEISFATFSLLLRVVSARNGTCSPHSGRGLLVRSIRGSVREKRHHFHHGRIVLEVLPSRRETICLEQIRYNVQIILVCKAVDVVRRHAEGSLAVQAAYTAVIMHELIAGKGGV